MKEVVLHGKLYTVTDQAIVQDFMFRNLEDKEERAFIMWAKDQPEGVIVNPVWHPIVQNELLLSGRGMEPAPEKL